MSKVKVAGAGDSWLTIAIFTGKLSKTRIVVILVLNLIIAVPKM